MRSSPKGIVISEYCVIMREFFANLGSREAFDMLHKSIIDLSHDFTRISSDSLPVRLKS